MTGRAVAAAVLALAGCTGSQSPQVPPDPRLRTLIEQPVGDFLADARVASLLAAGCDEVEMSQALFNALVLTREAGRPGTSPFDPEVAAREADTVFRARVADLRARYGRSVLRRDTCPVIAAETDRGTPATGFLALVVPLPGS